MCRLRAASLILISIFVFLGCSPTRNLEKIKTGNGYTSPPEAVIGKDFNTLLYKADIELLGNFYSGLFFIKYDTLQNAHFIVAMSEIGLSFLDMTFINDEMKINNIQPFLDRRSVKKNLKNSFKMLLKDVGVIEVASLYKEKDNGIKVFKIKDKSNRYYYFCNKHNKTEKIIKRRFWRNRQSILISYNSKQYPQSIVLLNEGINFSMELTLLKAN